MTKPTKAHCYCLPVFVQVAGYHHLVTNTGKQQHEHLLQVLPTEYSKGLFIYEVLIFALYIKLALQNREPSVIICFNIADQVSMVF